MASLYNRLPKSPFIWIKYRDANGKIVQRSTGYRCDRQNEVRLASQLRAQKALEELKASPANAGNWLWTSDFIKVRYASRPVTQERYLAAWATIQLFLNENEILSPQHVTRSYCFEYIGWRQKPDKAKGKYRAGHNTALLELKILGIVMQEALERGLCAGNPCTKLGIARKPRKLKPELTEAQCDLIASKFCLVEDPIIREMLENSFTIARYQGCRISETRLNPMTDVDLDGKTISFLAKGGKRFTTALHPKLAPFFASLRDAGRTSTWEPPANAPRQWASAKWWKFLDSHGLKKDLGHAVCFHCTRVTVVTKLARSNVSKSKAMAYVGHASETIHQTYQRLQVSDLSDCTDAI